MLVIPYFPEELWIHCLTWKAAAYFSAISCTWSFVWFGWILPLWFWVMMKTDFLPVILQTSQIVIIIVCGIFKYYWKPSSLIIHQFFPVLQCFPSLRTFCFCFVLLKSPEAILQNSIFLKLFLFFPCWLGIQYLLLFWLHPKLFLVQLFSPPLQKESGMLD